MARELAYSTPEKWPIEPELVVSEGEAVLRIPPLPRWLNIVQIIGSSLWLAVIIAQPAFGFWLAFRYFGLRVLVDIVRSMGPLVWLLQGSMILTFACIILIEIRNTARFGNEGTELRAGSGALFYRRVAFLRGIRVSTYSADQIAVFRTESNSPRGGKTRMIVHVRLRHRFPLRRIMKTRDATLPTRVENAFRAALRLDPTTGKALQTRKA